MPGYAAGREKGPTDEPVLVVLGAALSKEGAPSRALVRRVRHAARLYGEGRAPTVVMSGGLTAGRGAPPPWPESRVMRELAVTDGVPVACIVEESASTSTLENALQVRALMARQGWRKAVVVTDGFHAPRALLTFWAAGIRCSAAAAPGAWREEGPARVLAAALREAAALLWYAVLIARGRLRRAL